MTVARRLAILCRQCRSASIPKRGPDIVIKFNQNGEVSMTLGHAGMPGDRPDYFNRPSAVAIAPDRTIYVADGHGGARCQVRTRRQAISA